MITTINLKEIFNSNYNIIIILLTITFFILLTIITKDLKRTGKSLIYTSIFLIIFSLITPIFINMLTNNLIKIFLTPIINNIKINIIVASIITIIIGYILIIIEKKNDKTHVFFEKKEYITTKPLAFVRNLMYTNREFDNKLSN